MKAGCLITLHQFAARLGQRETIYSFRLRTKICCIM